ncbi:MAG: hypothetical protein JSR99_14060 [Proteobacteria bacterium]|nr:hypothetical protein [Pseudomonadota bacterium]
MSGEFWTSKHVTAHGLDAIDEIKKREESQAALIFALLIGAFAALGIFLFAHSAPDNVPLRVSDCTSVQSKSARLACFDTLARDTETPFKGAPPVSIDGQR